MDDYKKRQAGAREWSRKVRKADTSIKHGMREEMKEEVKKANTDIEIKKVSYCFENEDAIHNQDELIEAVETHIGQKLVEPCVTASPLWAYAYIVQGRALDGPIYDQKYKDIVFRVSKEDSSWKIVDFA